MLKKYKRSGEIYPEFCSKEILIHKNLHLLPIQRSLETELKKKETSNNFHMKIEDKYLGRT